MAGRVTERNEDYYQKTLYMAGPWGTGSISHSCKNTHASASLFLRQNGLSPGLSETVSKQDWTESKQSAVSTPRLFP